MFYESKSRDLTDMFRAVTTMCRDMTDMCRIRRLTPVLARLMALPKRGKMQGSPREPLFSDFYVTQIFKKSHKNAYKSHYAKMCCLGKVTSTKCPRARTRAVPALRLVVAGVAGDPDDGKWFDHIHEQSGTPSTGRPA